VDEDGLIYDGNTAGDFLFPAPGRVTLDDETLRDSLQNPSVHDPSIEEKADAELLAICGQASRR
jgi:hypothetical protein